MSSFFEKHQEKMVRYSGAVVLDASFAERIRRHQEMYASGLTQKTEERRFFGKNSSLFEAWNSSMLKLIKRDIQNVLIIDTTEQDVELIEHERYLSKYLEYAERFPEYTMGELVHRINNYFYREIYTEMPDISLVPLKNHALLPNLSYAFGQVCNDLGLILSEACKNENTSSITPLGIISHTSGKEYYLEFVSEESYFWGRELSEPQNAIRFTRSDLLFLFSNGLFEPSLDLLVIVEIVLLANNYKIIHFGNCIDRFNKYSKIMKVEYADKLTYWENDQESWNFARLCGKNGVDYPLHLLDLMALKEKGFANIDKYIARSIVEKSTIDIWLGNGEEIEKYLSC